MPGFVGPIAVKMALLMFGEANLLANARELHGRLLMCAGESNSVSCHPNSANLCQLAL